MQGKRHIDCCSGHVGKLSINIVCCARKWTLVVFICTQPFDYEGKHRGKLAVEGLKALQDRTDTLITVRNENTMSLLGKIIIVMFAL